MLNPHSPPSHFLFYGSSCKATDGKQKNGCEPHRNETRMMKDGLKNKNVEAQLNSTLTQRVDRTHFISRAHVVMNHPFCSRLRAAQGGTQNQNGTSKNASAILADISRSIILTSGLLQRCRYPCMHPCMHPHIHALIHTYMHSCMHPYIHACMQTSMHRPSCMHSCMHLRTNPCMHLYTLDACMNACRSACMPHEYIHGYMHEMHA